MSEDNILPAEEIEIEPHTIIQGDATELPFDDREFHAIVTDPPYNFDGGFMSSDWDNIGDSKEYQLWCEEWASEALRVLKPGGHLVAFSGSTQFHRLMCGIEDAGFELRETVMWEFGGGFPKNHNIEKNIDKKLNKENDREEVGSSSGPNNQEYDGERYTEKRDTKFGTVQDQPEKTAPASELAKKYEGFGTALKPAFEPICVARKPLEEDTIAEQVMATGTGGFNIDECRVEVDGERPAREETGDVHRPNTYIDDEGGSKAVGTTDVGRFPANVVLDQMAANMLDEEVGELKTTYISEEHENNREDTEFLDLKHPGEQGYDDSGGPSRFFYTSKASKDERTMDGRINCFHPTVKPIDLMEWLVNLVTAEGQKVLDPFLGSGTTLIACERDDRVGTGVDMNEDYCKLATKRLGCDMGNELGSVFDY